MSMVANHFASTWFLMDILQVVNAFYDNTVASILCPSFNWSNYEDIHLREWAIEWHILSDHLQFLLPNQIRDS